MQLCRFRKNINASRRNAIRYTPRVEGVGETRSPGDEAVVYHIKGTVSIDTLYWGPAHRPGMR